MDDSNFGEKFSAIVVESFCVICFFVFAGGRKGSGQKMLTGSSPHSDNKGGLAQKHCKTRGFEHSAP